MKKVFLGGSRRLARMSPQVKERAAKIIAEGLQVLVGDANGADKAIQKFFASKSYPNVVVFYSGTACRNNLGKWPTHQVKVDRPQRDFLFYAAKDLAMSEEADYGLMLWDGESQGTVNNVLNLLERGKKVVVYLSPLKEFLTFKAPADADELLRRLDPDVAEALDKKIGVRRRIAAYQQALRLA
jgi:adenine-specific DNA-methyltransferase